MSLTSEDLNQIKTVVQSVVKTEVASATKGLATKSELKDAVSGLATKDDLDRMEARLPTSMGLLERDTFSRLDNHEHRLQRLEAARP
jgi:hypothetical protein